MGAATDRFVGSHSPAQRSDRRSTPQMAAPWEPHEDDRLRQAIDRHRDKRGRPQWGPISVEVPGRSYAMCRNRWSRIMAAPEPMHVDEVGRPPNKCTACGQIKKGHTCTAIRDVVADLFSSGTSASGRTM